MSDEIMDDVVESEGRYSMTDLLEKSDSRDVKMILGDRERIRPAGKIRPGIKSPVGTCSPAQKELYTKLLADGFTFDAIDAEMLKLEAKGSTRRSCLRPSNCDYFQVNESDFSRPGDAQLIKSKYADPDGKVRRIPVWFSVSELHRAIPHAFTAFDGGGNLRCVSFYDGDKLKFRYLPKGLQNAKQEDWKILDSDDDEAATKACGLKVSLTGAYHVQVPGVRSVGGVLVNTKSWYGLSDAIAVIKEVRRVLGRFDGLLHGAPFFELVKVTQTMKVEGKTTTQWIVTLELSVDMMELAQYAEPRAVAARAGNALSLLTGRRPAVESTFAAPQPAALPENEITEESEAGSSEGVAAATTGSTAAEKQAGSAPAFDRKSAILALSSLVMPHGLTLDETLIYGTSQGMCSGDVNEMDRSEFTAVYKHVKECLAQDAEGFVAMVRDIAGSAPAGDDEPF